MPHKLKAPRPGGNRSNGANNCNTREDFTALVRERATGKWPAILRSLGVPAEALRNVHGPCPGCGGVDRFRFDDLGDRGTFVCGGAGDRLVGDGFTLVQHVFGWRFPEAVEAVARDLGLTKDATTTDEQRREWQEQARQRRAQADAERERKQRQCAEDAARLWSGAAPAGSHAYLAQKGVQAHGIRERGGLLLIPLMDAEGALWNCQKIDGNGQKRFLPGRKRGLFHTLGEPGAIVGIAEGYATAATVHEALGWPMVCAFDAGNLLPVAEAMRATYPEAEIVLMADNDAAGMKAARAAGEAVTGTLLAPAEHGLDWNDVGHEAVRSVGRELSRRAA